MKNILEFPKNKIIREMPADIEVIEKAKEKAINTFADQIVDMTIENILEQFESYGIDTETKHFRKDISLTIDGLRATVYRAFGIPHHLHDFIDNNVKMMNKETGEFIDLDEDDDECDGA